MFCFVSPTPIVAVLVSAIFKHTQILYVNGKMLLEALQIKQALHAQEKACASQGSNNGTQWETKTVLENPPSENCQPLRRLLCKLHGNGSTGNSATALLVPVCLGCLLYY